MKQETRDCQSCKGQFVIEPDDFAFYEKIKVPPPTWCPGCRLQRRLAFRNERFMYKTKSASSGKEIFSMYSPQAGVKTYENSAWFSDSWDAISFGHDYDVSRPFFVQLNELLHQVPLFALSVVNGENSDYSNNFTAFKNCYLAFNGNYSEDVAYAVGTSYAKNCIDCSYLDKAENCYECFWVNSCANCFYSTQCHSSFNLYFCKNCVGCNDCFGSVNLRNKKYVIFNKQYSKEEYEDFLRKFRSDSRNAISEMTARTRAHWLQYPMRYMEGLKNTNVSGEYIHNCKNVRDSYVLMDAENVRYSSYAEMGPIKDCYDYTVWGNGAEMVYESADCGLGVNNIRFGMELWPNVRNAEYSLFCQSSSDIFGCVGVKNKKFCILNKQYSEQEYRELREKIIAHMSEMPYTDARGIEYRYGEFYPPMFSFYAYNKTMAQENYPMKKSDALAAGYIWEDLQEKDYQPTRKGSELADDISGVSDAVVKDIFLCSSWGSDPARALGENCSKVFRIIPMELQFYRRFNIPVPTRCHNCRHFERTKQKQPMRLFDRSCKCAGDSSDGGAYVNISSHPHHQNGRCPNRFQTSYAPDRPEIVYCESCYNNEVA